jgi:hypothetical protein
MLNLRYLKKFLGGGGGCGSLMGMIMVQFEDSLCHPVILFRAKFSMKRKNSMIYEPTTTACTPNHLIPIELG